ncbi:mitochondrial ribosomal protein S25 [Phycomyces nitens]|nr:mitochondrial ribosomal protein S25 [Phycomyces nitens]
MAFRPPPTGLVRHVSNLLKGDLLKKAPVWLPVLQSIPSGPSIIRAQNPITNVSAQTELEAALSPAKAPITATRHKQKHLRTRPPRPMAITYPEDKLRRQFYKDHPYELARPKVLVENETGKNRTDFSRLLLPGMSLNEVDGEAVVKYQLYLMTHDKMPERKAYAKATSEFYEIRALQEAEERELRSNMKTALEALSNKKWSQHALRLEEKALKQGQSSYSF